jgi:hypothetical protein
MSSDGEEAAAGTPKKIKIADSQHVDVEQPHINNTRNDDSDGQHNASTQRKSSTQPQDDDASSHEAHKAAEGQDDAARMSSQGLQEALKLVLELYDVRDGLFSVPPTERIKSLMDRQRRVLDALDVVGQREKDGNRALYYYIRYVCMCVCVCVHACMHACMYVCMYVLHALDDVVRREKDVNKALYCYLRYVCTYMCVCVCV